MERVLETILAAKKESLERVKPSTPLAELKARALESLPPRAFKAALMANGISIIAEIKRASPSGGVIADVGDVADLARRYEEGGAAAISVLTEENYFSGSQYDLQRVKEVVALPVLRKDFIFDPYQVWESRAMGADAILLLASVLESVPLRELIMLARELQLAPLVEIHTRDELEKAINMSADLIGVNARDLTTFAVDIQVPLSMSKVIPPGITRVAESGVKTRDEVRRLEAQGYNAVLIGETLMRADDPVQKLKELSGQR
jgi:indole-3-glycerol phosphate synthase